MRTVVMGIQPASLRKGPIAGIDGLRAISVLLVLVAHYGLERIVPGGLGVTIFFFISGFLITTLLLREFEREGRIALGRFYARRALRLQPELLAFVLVSGFLLYEKTAPLPDVASALLYVSNYYQALGSPSPPDFTFRYPHLWSLAVEEHFYLTYPLLLSALLPARRFVVVTLIGVCLGALILREVYWVAGLPTFYLYVATETRLDGIAYGCLAAILLWHWQDTLIARLRGPRAVAPFAIGLTLLAGTLALRAPWFRETIRYSAQGLGLTALFIGFYASRLGAGCTRLLESAPLAWTGSLSYAAYLWHMESVFLIEKVLPLDAMKQTAGGLAAAILLPTALTFAIAFASHNLVYKRFLGWRHQFGSHAS